MDEILANVNVNSGVQKLSAMKVVNDSMELAIKEYDGSGNASFMSQFGTTRVGTLHAAYLPRATPSTELIETEVTGLSGIDRPRRVSFAKPKTKSRLSRLADLLCFCGSKRSRKTVDTTSSIIQNGTGQILKSCLKKAKVSESEEPPCEHFTVEKKQDKECDAEEVSQLPGLAKPKKSRIGRLFNMLFCRGLKKPRTTAASTISTATLPARGEFGLVSTADSCQDKVGQSSQFEGCGQQLSNDIIKSSIPRPSANQRSQLYHASRKPRATTAPVAARRPLKSCLKKAKSEELLSDDFRVGMGETRHAGLSNEISAVEEGNEQLSKLPKAVRAEDEPEACISVIADEKSRPRRISFAEEMCAYKFFDKNDIIRPKPKLFWESRKSKKPTTTPLNACHPLKSCLKRAKSEEGMGEKSPAVLSEISAIDIMPTERCNDANERMTVHEASKQSPRAGEGDGAGLVNQRTPLAKKLRELNDAHKSMMH